MPYRIKEARLEQGLTQEELAEKSGISRVTISGLESGKLVVTTTDTLIKIASALGRTVSEIFLE